MPRRDKTIYLTDIVRCCEELQTLKNDAVDFTHFSANNYFVRTAERCFQIIGEALYHINNPDRSIPINHKAGLSSSGIYLRMIMTSLGASGFGFTYRILFRI